MKTPSTMVRIKNRTGEVFEGTAFECARRMMPDAYMSSLQLGGMGDLALSDFCKEFGMKLITHPLEYEKWYISITTKTPEDIASTIVAYRHGSMSDEDFRREVLVLLKQIEKPTD